MILAPCVCVSDDNITVCVCVCVPLLRYSRKRRKTELTPAPQYSSGYLAIACLLVIFHTFDESLQSCTSWMRL